MLFVLIVTTVNLAALLSIITLSSVHITLRNKEINAHDQFFQRERQLAQLLSQTTKHISIYSPPYKQKVTKK